VLLNGGHSAKAGHLAGAFRRIGQGDMADEILATMRAAGYEVRESDPFSGKHVFGVLDRSSTPIVGRLRSMWEVMRGEVLAVFPDAPGLPRETIAYLQSVDDLYQSDAYHSLSIEGYNVTPALIERVQQGNWNPQANNEDRQSRDALAARGYWQAFGKVKQAIEQVLSGANAGKLARTAHREWYRELFQPCVAVGLIEAGALAGLQERRRLPENLAIRPSTLGSGPRRNACPVRSIGNGTRAECAGGTRSLDVWVHSPLSRRERTHGTFPDERNVGVRRISVDRDSR
jgi:hypothetical protein